MKNIIPLKGRQYCQLCYEDGVLKTYAPEQLKLSLNGIISGYEGGEKLEKFLFLKNMKSIQVRVNDEVYHTDQSISYIPITTMKQLITLIDVIKIIDKEPVLYRIQNYSSSDTALSEEEFLEYLEPYIGKVGI